jgi:LysR family hydrogen peroxide-inducible transcriptional activator
MTLVQYEYIVAVDEHRHFATAADKCFVTQPTLSMQIQKLEEQLGIIIFDRSRHPVVPTATGKMIIDQARVVLREAGKIKTIVENEKGLVDGTLSIGIIPTLSPYLLPLFIKGFSDQYPEVSLNIEELITEEIVDRLLKNQLDVGLFASPSGEANLSERPLFKEQFLAYVNEQHPLYKVKTIDPFLLELDDIWVLNEGHCFRNQVLNICQPKLSINPKLQFQSGSLEALKRLVDKQGGMTLLPELATIDFNDNEKKYLRAFVEPVPVRDISLVTHRSFVKRNLIDVLFENIISQLPVAITNSKNSQSVAWN